MKTIIIKTKILLLLSLLPLLLNAQPSWYYSNTGDNHSILIQFPNNITINGVMLSTNDYIGVFYDSLGTLACGGYQQFSGATSVVTAWGSESGLNNGFAANEPFVWKIWRESDSATFNATATYLSGFPNQGGYVSFGMSGVFSLEAIVGSDVAIGNIISPISGCGNLTSTEVISFQISNIGSVDVNSIIVSYSVDGGTNYVYDTITQLIPTNTSYLYTSTLTYDLSSQGTYDLIVSVLHPNDIDLSNNTLSFIISNGITPTINLSGLATSYCTTNELFLLEGVPAGGLFFSDSLAIVPGNLAYFSNAGTFDVYYTYTDSIGCSSTDTVVLEILPVPDINLGDSLNPCDGDIVDISVPSGYLSYLWSTGSSDTLISINQPGLYSITVTNSDGCTTVDSIPVIYSPNPIVNIQGDTIACEGETISLSVSGQGTSYLWNTGSFNDILNVTESNTYSVIVSSNGCVGYDSILVYFNPAPAIDLGADISMCEGESVIIDAGVFPSYIWSDGSTDQTITVVDEGVYSVTVTNSIPCEASDEVNVSFIPDPIAEFSFVVDYFTVSFTNESLNEDAGSWEWQFGDGNTSTDENPIHTYSAIGDYNVSLKVSNDCENDSIILSLSILDVNILNNDMNISIIPNPSNGQFSLEFQNKMQEQVKFTIINSLGQEVITNYDKTYSSNINMDFNIIDQPAGIYFINIQTQTLSYNKKLIIR